MKKFPDDNEQIWSRLFSHSDRLRRLEKIEKTNFLFSVTNFICTIYLVITVVNLWMKYD